MNDKEYIEGFETLALNKQNQLHELAAKKEEHNHEATMKKLKLVEYELGWLSKVFGSGTNSSKNITALVNICLLIGGIAISLTVYLTDKNVDFVYKIWAVIAPIITLSLGYLFGKK